MLNRTSTNPRISGSVDSTTGACHLGAASLARYDVYDVNGKWRGKIKEIVLDVRTGCVRYAVIALGGFLGIGAERVAVPWSALTPDVDSRCCIVDVPKMKLMAVPVSARDPWLQRANPAGGEGMPPQ